MTNINEYICINLNALKRNNPEYYDQVYNILTFNYLQPQMRRLMHH